MELEGYELIHSTPAYRREAGEYTYLFVHRVGAYWGYSIWRNADCIAGQANWHWDLWQARDAGEAALAALLPSAPTAKPAPTKPYIERVARTENGWDVWWYDPLSPGSWCGLYTPEGRLEYAIWGPRDPTPYDRLDPAELARRADGVDALPLDPRD